MTNSRPPPRLPKEISPATRPAAFQSSSTRSLLDRARAGSRQALDQLFTRLHHDLVQAARQQRKRWRGNDTLDTAALVNETYVRLAQSERLNAQDRGHFLALAAQVMRRILINYAEAQGTAKRGGGLRRVDVASLDAQAPSLDGLVTLCQLLGRLEELNPRLARVVECRVLAGLEVTETADALGVSPATIKRDWVLAAAWLYRELRA